MAAIQLIGSVHVFSDKFRILTKGCSCRSGCLSHRCGCVRNGHHCGPGCHCQNCKNATTDTTNRAIEHTIPGSGPEEETASDLLTECSEEETAVDLSSEDELDSSSNSEGEESNIETDYF